MYEKSSVLSVIYSWGVGETPPPPTDFAPQAEKMRCFSWPPHTVCRSWKKCLIQVRLFRELPPTYVAATYEKFSAAVTF